MPKLHWTGCLHLHKLYSFAFILLLMVAMASTVQAEDALDVLDAHIQQFMQSSDGALAPETATHAQAYLGAAMLARDQHDTSATQHHLNAARQTLEEAKRIVADFRHQHADILAARTAALEAIGQSNDAKMQQARHVFKKLIHAVERGDFNQSDRLVGEVRTAFQSVADARLPRLLERTGEAISAASAVGAKQYAPYFYNLAKAWFVQTHAWQDGINQTRPLHPQRGLQLALYAKDLALRVKQWRKHANSFENIMRDTNAQHLKLAEALGLSSDRGDPLAHVPVDDLLARIYALKTQRETERSHYQQEIIRLEQQHKKTLTTQLNQQKNTLLTQGSSRIQNLKEAFRVKLERETFEQKRQDSVRKLFHKKEVEIFVNLDGSLLIRLSSITFARGRSSLNKKYYDLLNRLNKALEYYPQREVHIEGHTDSKGDAKKNQKLSLKRAEAVRDFLIATGAKAGRLKTLGYGEIHPVASNDYKKGRAMNRRIDVLIQADHDD